MHGYDASSGCGYPQLAAYPACRILLTYSAAAEFHEHGHEPRDASESGLNGVNSPCAPELTYQDRAGREDAASPRSWGSCALVDSGRACAPASCISFRSGFRTFGTDPLVLHLGADMRMQRQQHRHRCVHGHTEQQSTRSTSRPSPPDPAQPASRQQAITGTGSVFWLVLPLLMPSRRAGEAGGFRAGCRRLALPCWRPAHARMAWPHWLPTGHSLGRAAMRPDNGSMAASTVHCSTAREPRLHGVSECCTSAPRPASGPAKLRVSVRPMRV